MPALLTWPDEHAFLSEDLRRRCSHEVDLGATWREVGSADTWRVAWLRETGELYACLNDGLAGGGPVRLLEVVPDEAVLDALLTGWRDVRDREDGLSWLAARTGCVAA